MTSRGAKRASTTDPQLPTSKRVATPSLKKKAAQLDVEDASTSLPSLHKVMWQANPQWTDTLIMFLSENPDTRLKLFSDSVKLAKAQGRAKVWTYGKSIFFISPESCIGQVVNGKPKKHYHALIATAIFDQEGNPECPYFWADLAHYVIAVGSCIAA